ncbi:MAG: HlyC/CorC family transporter [Gammaproteobacteria bacterium]
MSDEHQTNGNGNERGWLGRILHFLSHEPQDKDDLIAIMRAAKQRALIDTEAFDMIEGVLAVSQTQVRDIMVPRAQMVTLEFDQSLEEILPTVLESGHSRFPIVGEDRDDVIGILLAKDLLKYALIDREQFSLKGLIRAATFVPESKRLNVLLKEFRVNRKHMAIVVDEYGGVVGLVTIEDILEEIVGDISDESDIEEIEFITRKANGEYAVNALTPIEDFNAYFNATFSDAEFDTIGGLVMQHLGYLPKAGEVVELDNFVFTVTNADQRRIHWMIVKMLAGEESPKGE